MSRQRGFSLIELMLVLALIAIMVGIGVPGFQTMVLDNRLTNTTNALLGALQYARSEAVTQRTPISVCPAADANLSACANSTDWSHGALIVKGATTLKALPAISDTVTITGSSTKIEYKADGTSDSSTFSIQDSRNSPRQIKINSIGQACAGSYCS